VKVKRGGFGETVFVNKNSVFGFHGVVHETACLIT
jgi:hypothetical protein